MQEIIKTEEGQQFFDFLDMNWGQILALYHKTHIKDRDSVDGMIEAVKRVIDIEGECFYTDAMEENEFKDIVEYFIKFGSSF